MNARYLSPSERFYRGEVTREEARRLVLENSQQAQRATGSPELNRVLRVLGVLLVPFVFIADIFSARRD